MEKFDSSLIFMIIVVMSYIAILGLAIYKLFKSNLSIWNKTIWGFAIFTLHLIAAMVFIVYHDYYLNSEKRIV
ncbi:MAG: hypothetical protein AB9846_13605 [Tenuifilaceae bacterium]